MSAFMVLMLSRRKVMVRMLAFTVLMPSPWKVMMRMFIFTVLMLSVWKIIVKIPDNFVNLVLVVQQPFNKSIIVSALMSIGW